MDRETALIRQYEGLIKLELVHVRELNNALQCSQSIIDSLNMKIYKLKQQQEYRRKKRNLRFPSENQNI